VRELRLGLQQLWGNGALGLQQSWGNGALGLQQSWGNGGLGLQQSIDSQLSMLVIVLVGSRENITTLSLPFGTVLATLTAHGYSGVLLSFESFPFFRLTWGFFPEDTSSRLCFLINSKSVLVLTSWQCRCNSWRFLYSPLPPMALGMMWSTSITSSFLKINSQWGHFPFCHFRSFDTLLGKSGFFPILELQ